MDNLLENAAFKELRNVFSYVLTFKDCYDVSDSTFKDLGKILPTRSLDDIVVVDSNFHQIEGDINRITIKDRCNGESYKDLIKLKTTLKSVLLE